MYHPSREAKTGHASLDIHAREKQNPPAQTGGLLLVRSAGLGARECDVLADFEIFLLFRRFIFHCLVQNHALLFVCNAKRPQVISALILEVFVRGCESRIHSRDGDDGSSEYLDRVTNNKVPLQELKHASPRLLFNKFGR